MNRLIREIRQNSSNKQLFITIPVGCTDLNKGDYVEIRKIQ